MSESVLRPCRKCGQSYDEADIAEFAAHQQGVCVVRQRDAALRQLSTTGRIDGNEGARMSDERVWGHELMRKGGKWLGAARSWLQHKRTTKGRSGDQITWGDPNARFELGADSIEELAAEVAAAVYNERNRDHAATKAELAAVREELAEAQRRLRNEVAEVERLSGRSRQFDEDWKGIRAELDAARRENERLRYALGQIKANRQCGSLTCEAIVDRALTPPADTAFAHEDDGLAASNRRLRGEVERLRAAAQAVVRWTKMRVASGLPWPAGDYHPSEMDLINALASPDDADKVSP